MNLLFADYYYSCHIYQNTSNHCTMFHFSFDSGKGFKEHIGTHRTRGRIYLLFRKP